MADKGWTSRVATAAGAAAGTGAAQLGLGYGLGVVVWPVAATSDDSDWLGSLGWATWITASATVFGAVLASRLGGGPATRWSGARRLGLATSAGVGALVAVALIALPARSAVRDDAFSPQVTAGGYALLGVALGIIVAYWAVVSRPVAANLMATGVLLWALAITAIVVELAWQRDSATYLTSWQFAQVAEGERFGTIFWPSALLTLAAAFLIGALAVTPAIRKGNFGPGAAVSGVVGPLLVAVAFLALAPRLTGALGPLESAYLIAPYAVLAGLAGSSLAVTTGRAAADRRSHRLAAGGAVPLSDGDTARPGSDSTLPGGNIPTPSESASGQERHREAAQRGAGDDTEVGGVTGQLPSDIFAADKSPDSGHSGASARDQTSVEQADALAEETDDQAATQAPRQRGRFARLIGRAKVPAQPSKPSESPVGAAVQPADLPESPAGAARRSYDPSTGPGGADSKRPTATAAATQATQATQATPGSSSTPRSSILSEEADSTVGGSAPGGSGSNKNASAVSPQSGSSLPTSPAQPSSSDKPGRTATSSAARRPRPTAAAKSSEGADPEIAAAARPSRDRARKATTSSPRPAKSTVTPPPSEPTIAKINPNPPVDS